MDLAYTPALRAQVGGALAGFARIDPAHDGGFLKHAAVVIVLCETAPGSGEAAFLLTRRTAGLRGHANQWALPGGRCDAKETAAQAALRELHEELGLRLVATDLLGSLDDYPTRSGYRITPVVAWCDGNGSLMPNADEVASVHRVPLVAIAHPEAVSFVKIAESERRVVRLRLLDQFIHAPTAAMLYQFGELLCGRITRVAELEQPVFAWK